MANRIRAFVAHDGLVHPECARDFERTLTNARFEGVEYYRCPRCDMRFEDKSDK